MKRKNILLSMLCLLFAYGLHAQRDCESDNYLQQQLIDYPWMQDRLDALEQFTNTYVAGGCDARKMIVRIPVVFHVVYNTAAQNVSNAYLYEQLNVLNQDFGRYNADAGNTPSAFAGVSVDTEIQFCLATRAPNCGTTTGITRTYTSKTGFTYTADDVKDPSTGGVAAWPRDEYLNIWVCNLTDALGYAQFPGGPASTDGVVLLYNTVGGPSLPATNTPFHLGRTGTHEVGHWLNLRHIWGDDAGGCGGTDFVGDTPNQAGSNWGCPSFPLTDACTGSSPGVMFMNYMDYSDDACYNMFTNGQKLRMHACLESERLPILSSLGCTPGATAVDLFMRDSPDDVGNEPNAETGWLLWDSQDLWVRNTADGSPYHQNPINSVANTVYIRVLNKGCATSSGTEKLNVYWTKASTVGPWPSAWNGTQNFSCGSFPLKGNIINTGGPISIPPIPAGGSVVLQTSWTPPNPANYVCASPPSEHWHFCLLARIETTPSSPFGMTFPEGTDVGTNTRNNNNIVWKNLHIDPPTLVTMVASNEEVPTRFNLEYAAAANQLRDPLVNNATLRVNLGADLYQRWVEGGQMGRGFVLDQEQPFTIRLTEPNASIDNLLLNPEDWFVPVWTMTFAAATNGVQCIYLYNVILRNHITHAVAGGVTYELHKPTCFEPNAGDDQTICAGCITTLSVEAQGEQGELATYTWRDLNTGQLVGELKSIEVAPAQTTTYRVTVAGENGCVDSDDVTVNVGGIQGKKANETVVMQALPNPFGSLTRIQFTLPKSCAADLKVYDELGRVVATLFEGNAQAGKLYEMEFKPRGLEPGIYIARLNACGYEAQFIKLIYLD